MTVSQSAFLSILFSASHLLCPFLLDDNDDDGSDGGDSDGGDDGDIGKEAGDGDLYL